MSEYICDNIDANLDYVVSYIEKNDYMAIYNLFEISIAKGAKEAFEVLLPHIDPRDKVTAMELVCMYGDIDMMSKISDEKPYSMKGKLYHEHPLWIAVSYDNYDMTKWLFEFGYSWDYDIGLFYAIIHESLDILILLHKYNACGERKNMLQYTLRHILCSKGNEVYPLTPDNYNEESMQFLAYLHDNFKTDIVNNYNWECTVGKECFFCQKECTSH